MHATHVNYMYKYPESLFVKNRNNNKKKQKKQKNKTKNVERGQGRMSFYFWTNID